MYDLFVGVCLRTSHAHICVSVHVFVCSERVRWEFPLTTGTCGPRQSLCLIDWYCFLVVVLSLENLL